MRTVTLAVAPVSAAKARLAAAFEGKSQGGARLSFASHELLWRVLTPKRWALLQAMAGAGAISLREAARRVGRDVKAVHTDAHALLAAGVIEKTESGALLFPYEAVRVDFTLRAAA